MMQRVAALEQRIRPDQWGRVILRYTGQTLAEAVAFHEAETGTIADNTGAFLNVIIRKPYPAPRHA
jgi:hypothetical protein